MQKWVTLEPVKLYAGGLPSTPVSANKTPTFQYIGPLPIDVHLRILEFLPIYSLTSYARTSRALSRLTSDERLWKKKCDALGLDKPGISALLTDLEAQSGTALGRTSPPVLEVQSEEEDDFGDFTSASLANSFPSKPRDMSGGFIGPADTIGLSEATTNPSKSPSRTNYIRAHRICLMLSRRLSAAPHLLLTELFPPPVPPLLQQSKILRLLTHFLSPTIQPIPSWPHVRLSLLAAIDRFQANLLANFEAADGRGDESLMTQAAWASWESWDSNQPGEWEMGRVWAEKLEIFYEVGRWDPLSNFTQEGALAFESMDVFMNHILDALQSHGPLVVRVFPPDSGVLLSFADKLANEVIGEYITPLLSRARGLPAQEVFLQAVAASFAQSWRIVDALLAVAHTEAKMISDGASTISSTASTLVAKSNDGDREIEIITRNQAEDVIFRMFEPNMDEYLDEEIEHVKQALEKICLSWDDTSSDSTTRASAPSSTPQFLTSHSNPAQVKRTVLASFTDLMLLPVTIIPRTVGAVGAIVTTGGNAAVNGISMLNPARWGGVNGATSFGGARDASKYDIASLEPSTGPAVLDDEQDWDDSDVKPESTGFADDATVVEVEGIPPTEPSSASKDHARGDSTVSVASTVRSKPKDEFSTLQLLLSLDICLEIIHADRESLKRVETFKAYPGEYGHRVRDTIEEIFILMLQALAERHVAPGFAKATEQMKSYKPEDASGETTDRVAPLMQFLELVHIGDMMQSLVQVYFDKELATYIDKTDFLNGVVREKKRFENTLDECVAAGLNAGTELLMNQVEHIIQTKTGARVYYPLEGATMDLQPTQGCQEAIACLQTHIALLKGTTSKEVLDVFHQEIGIRLHGIIQKHLKRQIISLEGGFQVIADLNAYHSFIATLRTPAILADFANLKMLGHVYIVEDATDLAQIVRDVTRYGGSFRPEDIYEFIQRRSDWKKIERTVDKAMYNLSFKEDCIVC